MLVQVVGLVHTLLSKATFAALARHVKSGDVVAFCCYRLLLLLAPADDYCGSDCCFACCCCYNY